MSSDDERRLIEFAEDFCDWLVDDPERFFAEELEDMAPALVDHGMLVRVEYDPDEHGEIEDAEKGQMVWLLTDLALIAAKRARERQRGVKVVAAVTEAMNR